MRALVAVKAVRVAWSSCAEARARNRHRAAITAFNATDCIDEGEGRDRELRIEVVRKGVE
jgi:hypothetical protein